MEIVYFHQDSGGPTGRRQEGAQNNGGQLETEEVVSGDATTSAGAVCGNGGADHEFSVEEKRAGEAREGRVDAEKEPDPRVRLKIVILNKEQVYTDFQSFAFTGGRPRPFATRAP